MAFNKVFIILVLASCALAMPVLPVDEATKLIEVESTAATVNVKVEDSTAVQESITTVAVDKAIANEDETTATDPTTESTVNNDKSVGEDVVKRSVNEESSDADDMETAAGTNVLRPLFVYRQQVAYRQRIRNANRRGNRRF